ncbi:protein phosphatase 2C [Bacillus tropicus]|uniref:protein phosphatase 2C n=1 Tax=Bacillus tropicus TaxID=2026188 RepID=UPI001CFE245D|nr:protein phosphatase 2C [Bacillus tropicus]USK99911.1 protein phosphatase 2C [Bacillus tropicus]
MLKKLKKVIIIAAAAVMLSAGFATAAPNEAHAAHWADNQMNWAFNKGIITADLRDSLATRQDVWIMIARWDGNYVGNYEKARQYVVRNGISDGTRGTNWVTRNETVAMLYNYFYGSGGWNPNKGFGDAFSWGRTVGVYDGSRGNDAATRAEVVTMIYNTRSNR